MKDNNETELSTISHNRHKLSTLTISTKMDVDDERNKNNGYPEIKSNWLGNIQQT